MPNQALHSSLRKLEVKYQNFAKRLRRLVCHSTCLKISTNETVILNAFCIITYDICGRMHATVPRSIRPSSMVVYRIAGHVCDAATSRTEANVTVDALT